MYIFSIPLNGKVEIGQRIRFAIEKVLIGLENCVYGWEMINGTTTSTEIFYIMSSNLYLMFYKRINLDLNLMKKGQIHNLLMWIY